MAIQTVGKIFEAGGISGTDKLVLLAFGNYANQNGYCWPGEERVADDCGISVRTVQRAKANLTQMGLIKSVRRKDRVTGEPISNLTRINIAKIESMRRSAVPYDDDFMDRITFDESDNSGQSEPSDWREVPVRLTGGTRQIGGQSVSGPSGTLPPSSPPSRLTARRGRGAKPRKRTEETSSASFSHTHLKTAEALVLDLPGKVSKSQHGKLVQLVCAAFDAGWSPSGLSQHLRDNCIVDRVTFHGSVYLKHAGPELPPVKSAEAARARMELCPVCDEHGFTLQESACSKDPDAAPGVCLHGQPDPWDDEEYRAGEEARRAEALHAQLRAQEEARDRRVRQQRAKAQQAAQEVAEREARRRAAREFLATAEPYGDETADTVRRLLLEADDPADLEDLEDLVSFGIGMVESGGSVIELAEVVRTVPRADWRTAFLDRSVTAA